MHGTVFREVTASSADELSMDEEEVVELELDAAAETATGADTPLDTTPDPDRPDDTR